MQSMARSILFILMASISFLSSAEARTPYEIIAQAPASDWRDIDPENSLYITLTSGTVVVEMAPKFAPKHVENTKTLVREGLFNNTSFYRVIDGFVAQGGPTELADKDKPKKGQLCIAAEFTQRVDQPLSITPLAAFDGYADEVGYIDEFAVGRSKDKKDNWLLHCYGAFAMGRANEANSGGTELYVVIGSAQRYLDRNTTVFGRVIAGMEHLQALQRSTTLTGNIDVADKNKIIKITVGSDLKQADRMPLQVMKTDSASFKQLIESRKNRNGQWFLYQHNYIDVCSVAIPVRLASNTHP
jgi:peptidylprolyl isomerase